MALIINKVNEDDEFEQIGRSVDGEVSDERLLNIYPKRVWEQKEEIWIAERIDGPMVVAGLVDDSDVDPIENPVTLERRDNQSSKADTIAESAVSSLFKGTPEGVPEGAEYFEPEEEVPADYTEVEGPEGATWGVEPGQATAEDGEDDVEYVGTPYGDVPDTEGPIPPDMRDEPIGSDSHPVLWKRPEGEEETQEYIEEMQSHEWFAEGEEIFEKAFHGDENTEEYYTDDEGNWDEERQQKHDEWTDELLNEDASMPEGEEPIGMILIGPPGAGKGWWQEQAGEGEYGETGEFVDRDFTHISSDETKEPIPEYNETNAAEVHDEASEMAKYNLAPKAVEDNQNMVIDKVATSPGTTMDMVEDMREKGYDIRATFVNVPKEKAIHNAVSRFHEEGRFTPLDYVDEAVEDSRESFDQIVEQADIPEDKVGRFDNDVEWGEAPDAEQVGEDLLKFYRQFFGWDKGQTYKSIEDQGVNGDNNGRETRSGRDRGGDSTVDEQRLRRVGGGRDRSGGRERVTPSSVPEDRKWLTAIDKSTTTGRVSVDALGTSSSVTKNVKVNGVREVPDDKVASVNDEDGLHYKRDVDNTAYTPSNWLEFADNTPDILVENSDEVVKRLEETYRDQVWPDDLSKAPQSWEDDDDVSKTLRDWVPEVVKERDPLHGDYEGVPNAASIKVKNEIEDSLTQPQGWSIDSISKRLREEFDWMDKDHSDSIARMEVAAVLNTSKSVMYRAAEKEDETFQFTWEGPDDSHTSQLCSDIKGEIESRGGSVSFGVLEDILYEKAREYKASGGTPHRVEELVPHFGCRHTIERAE